MEIRLNLRDLTNPKDVEKLVSTISQISDELDIIYTESAPNGNINARQGRRCLYKNGSNYETWENVDGSTTWQQVTTGAPSSYALDNAVVKLTGDQTVAGVKTFTSFSVTPSSLPTTDYQVANKKYVDNALPAGVFVPFGGSSAPTGWLLCDGSAVSRTTYAALFTAIGTAYGVGDNSTTFNVPNLKGKIPVGYNSAETEFDALGETGGEKTHALTEAELASHSHVQGDGQKAVNAGAATANTLISDNHAGGAVSTATTGSGTAHNNLQPYVVVNYIIKT
jgi:microcystin-dependent protein